MTAHFIGTLLVLVMSLCIAVTQVFFGTNTMDMVVWMLFSIIALLISIAVSLLFILKILNKKSVREHSER